MNDGPKAVDPSVAAAAAARLPMVPYDLDASGNEGFLVSELVGECWANTARGRGILRPPPL